VLAIEMEITMAEQNDFRPGRMTGIRLDRTADHFVLRSVKSDGTTTTMPLSSEEVATLAAMAPTLLQMVAAADPSLRNRSSVVPVVAMEVFDFQVRPEMLQAKILLLLRLGTDGSGTAAYAFSPSQAKRLAHTISPLLQSMGNPSIRQ
jgi:hypothetical protein